MTQSIPRGRMVAALVLGVGMFVLGRVTAPLSGGLTISRLTAVTLPHETPGGAGATTSGNQRSAPATDAASRAPASVEQWRSNVEGMVPSPRRDEELIAMLGKWASTDPLAARAYAEKLLNRDTRAQAFTAVFASWAKQDPQAAWTWVQQNETGDRANLRTVLLEATRANPQLGARFAAGIAEQHPEQASEVYLYALDGLIHDGNYEAAKALAAGAKTPDQEQKNSLLNFVAGQWARYQPEQAAPWVQSLPAGDMRDMAMVGVTQAWADIDPARAADFAVNLPPGELRQTALRQAISRWTMDDPAVASKWILQFDAHQDFDQAVAAIATSNTLINRNIGLALNWAGTIQDPILRQQSTSIVLSNWHAQNPSAALSYIKTSPDVPAELRQELLQKLAPPLPYLSRGSP